MMRPVQPVQGQAVPVPDPAGRLDEVDVPGFVGAALDPGADLRLRMQALVERRSG